jgi:hypothetical protein
VAGRAPVLALGTALALLGVVAGVWRYAHAGEGSPAALALGLLSAGAGTAMLARRARRDGSEAGPRAG